MGVVFLRAPTGALKVGSLSIIVSKVIGARLAVWLSVTRERKQEKDNAEAPTNQRYAEASASCSGLITDR